MLRKLRNSLMKWKRKILIKFSWTTVSSWWPNLNGELTFDRMSVPQWWSLVHKVKVSVITVGILHGEILSFEGFVRNVWGNYGNSSSQGILRCSLQYQNECEVISITICTRFRNIFNSSSCWLINRVRLWCRWWQLYIVMKGFVCCCWRLSLHKCEENKGGEQLTNQCLAHTQDMLERKPFTDEIISYKCFKTRISPCRIPTVITESLVVYTRLNPY